MSTCFAGGYVLLPMLAGFAVFAAPIEPARFAQAEVIVASPIDARSKLPPFDRVLYRAHRQLPDAEVVCVDPDELDSSFDTLWVASQSARGARREARASRAHSY